MVAKIRKAIEPDLMSIQKVARTTWHSTYDGIIPIQIQNSFLSKAYSDANMLRRLERTLLLVAEVNDEIVGFANFSTVKDDGKAELLAIYITPQWQGNGIGSALLAEGLANLTDAKTIYINVERENKVGKAFYEHKQFQVVEEIDEEFEGHILKTIRMVLYVKPALH